MIGADVGTVAGIGEVGARISEDALEVCAAVDAILDFTSPAATVEFAGLAANARIVHVIGTTGFSAADEAAIAAAARHATIVKAGNMSLGVNLLVALTRKVAAALDADFDIELVEMHHRHKVDAPSGTALMLARAAADGRAVDLEKVAVRTRDGHTGERSQGLTSLSLPIDCFRLSQRRVTVHMQERTNLRIALRDSIEIRSSGISTTESPRSQLGD